MRKRDALKLHNGDEAVLKETGEVLTVLRTYPGKEGVAVVEVFGPKSGYAVLSHLEVS